MLLSPLWLLGWRVVVLWGLALAPWAAPLDVGPAATVDKTLVTALLGWLGLAATLHHLRRRLSDAATRTPATFLGALTLLVSLGVAWRATHDAAPLAAWLPFVSPLVWLTLAALAYEHLRGRRGLAAALAVAAVAGASTAFAWPRLRSQAGMWADVMRRDPSNVRAYMALMPSLRASGNAPRALEVLERCVHQAATPLPCLTERAALAMAGHDYSVAAEMAERALQIAPNDADAAVLRALALIAIEPPPRETDAAIERALRTAPSDGRAHYARAVLLDRQGHGTEARAAVARAVALRPTADALVLQASLAMRGNDTPLARRATEAALRLAPHHLAARYNLGLLEQQAGHFNPAREAYLAVLRDEPGQYAARYNLALLTLQAGARDEARHHCDLLIRFHPRDGAAVDLRNAIESSTPPPAAAFVTQPATRTL